MHSSTEDLGRQVELIRKKQIRALRLYTKRAQRTSWEMDEIPCDDYIALANYGCRKHMAISGIGQTIGTLPGLAQGGQLL